MEATNVSLPALFPQNSSQLPIVNQADLPGTTQQPLHEVDWTNDTITETSFLVEEQSLSFLLNDHNDIFATMSSMDLDPNSVSSYYTHSSVPSYRHVPFQGAPSIMHLPTFSYAPLAEGLEVSHGTGFGHRRAHTAKDLSKLALSDPLDIAPEILRALKQKSDNRERSGLPWCLSIGQGPLHRYVGSSFWALSGTGVSSHLHLTPVYKPRYMGRDYELGIYDIAGANKQMAKIEADT